MSVLLICAEQEKKPYKISVLERGAVHVGDYFAAGNNIEISGEVKGDVYAFGQQVVIDGKVDGDVIVGGGTIDISGEILGSIRSMSGQILITGTIGRNVTLIAGNAQLLYPAKIAGSIVCLAGNTDLAASIGAGARVMSSNLRVSGDIKNKLYAQVGELRLTSHALIGGDLEYSSNTEALIDPQAQILGKVITQPAAFSDVFKGKWLEGFFLISKIAGLLMNFLFSFVIGWVLIRAYPHRLEAILHALTTNPMKSFGLGIMIVVILPLASLLLLITILGVPFALALMGFNVIFFYAAKTIPIMYVSNRYLTKLHLKPNSLSLFFVGLVIYFLLVRIPVVGILIALACLLFGLGASASSGREKHKI